jgi:DNA-binding CsgD family transcriptional regulator
MADDSASPSLRDEKRAAARARRRAKATWRETYFDLFAFGHSPRSIAEVAKVSVSTVRREINRAIDQRRLDAPDRFVHVQVARLNKALRLADASIERGELNAVGPLVQLVAALDRYHGIGSVYMRTPPAPERSEPLPPPAPPLALTHSAPPLEAIEPSVVEGAEKGA